MSESLINIFLYLTYALAIGGLVLAVAFPVVFLVKNPAKAKGSLIGVGLVLVLFLVGYVLSGNEVLSYYPKFGVDAGISKIIGGSLITLYVLAIGATVSAVVAEVLRFFK